MLSVYSENKQAKRVYKIRKNECRFKLAKTLQSQLSELEFSVSLLGYACNVT